MARDGSAGRVQHTCSHMLTLVLAYLASCDVVMQLPSEDIMLVTTCAARQSSLLLALLAYNHIETLP